MGAYLATKMINTAVLQQARKNTSLAQKLGFGLTFKAVWHVELEIKKAVVAFFLVSVTTSHYCSVWHWRTSYLLALARSFLSKDSAALLCGQKALSGWGRKLTPSPLLLVLRLPVQIPPFC